jgi:hypothetical protein
MTAGTSTSYQDQNQDTPNIRWNHQRSNPIESIHEYQMALTRSHKKNKNIINDYRPTPRPMDLHTNTNQQIPIILILTVPQQTNQERPTVPNRLTNVQQQPDFEMTNENAVIEFWRGLMELKNKRGW